ncbi:MAG: hypothetical protein KAV87_48190 [Desulfobacteraceae bacterium]|nr:hypothetical protein [Desulfobacteraceae bacterium]
MMLNLYRQRLITIRAAARPPAMLPVLSWQIPFHVKEGISIIQDALRTVPLIEILSDPAMLAAADEFGQWLEHIQTTAERWIT